MINCKTLIVSYHLAQQKIGRPWQVYKALKKLPVAGNIKIIGSNFDHIKKVSITDQYFRLNVPSYTKNISLKRLCSYLVFARKLNKFVKVIKPKLVYTCVPDYIAAMLLLQKKTVIKTKIIIDFVDLWPEALPLPKLINILLKDIGGLFFRPVRRWLFRKADMMLFQSVHFLKQFGGGSSNYKFLPMCSSGKALLKIDAIRTTIKDEIRILFLGSLNNITDTESLISMLNLLARHRKVCLSVVGGGQGLKKLRQRLANTAVYLILRGFTFDQGVKKMEMAQAHFGFNGYKETTDVSVSYKALDYLQHGLPIINYTKGDLTNLLSDNDCGYNYQPGAVKTTVNKILSLTDCDHKKMCRNARRVFEENFSFARFRATLAGYVESLFPEGRKRKASA